MNIFITGGTGFIGQAIIKKLSEEGHRILALVREENKKEILKNLRVEKVLVGDLTNQGFVNSLGNNLEDTELIIHLAAIAGEHDGVPWREYELQNVKATKYLLGAARNKVKRFIYLSSISVYGVPLQKPADEKALKKPITNYARSKIEAENEVISSGLNYLILRPGIVFGPRDTKGFILRYLRLAKKFPRLMVGRGENRLPFVYIDDLVKVISFFVSSSFRNEEYIFVPYEPKMKELSAIVTRALALPEKKIVAPVGLVRLFASFSSLISQRNVTLFTSDTHFSSEKINKKTGFRPETDFEETLKRTIKWYQANGYL